MSLAVAISGAVGQWCMGAKVTGKTAPSHSEFQCPREKNADQAQRSGGCSVFQQRVLSVGLAKSLTCAVEDRA
jgi:hypothetical protein